MFQHNRKTVLFMTFAEAGQSNSIFALAFELLTHPNVDVHVASFPVLRKRAEELSNSARVVERKHPSSVFTFQEIGGMSPREAGESKGLSEATIPHPPLARTHDEGLNTLITLATGWNGKGTTCCFWFTSLSLTKFILEYARVVDSCKNIIGAVNPGIILVDSPFSAACEACWSLNKNYIISCPMAPLDVARDLQPIWKVLFYYPVQVLPLYTLLVAAADADHVLWVCSFASGIPFPIPWSCIPKNVALNFVIIFRLLTHPDLKELMSYRHSHGMPGKFPVAGPSVKRSVHTLCFGLPELEYPITLPPNVGLYGPVTLDSTPLSKEDELSTWLDGGKTIMMSMGTHFHYSEAQVRNTIRGFIAGTSSTDQVF